MCKLGDIIVVKDFIGDDGKKITQHSFVVINDKPDFIEGLNYDFVANVMSSFKNEEQRQKKLKYEENMELPVDAMKTKNLKKSSYIKADKAFYFNKDKLNYYVLATLKEEYLDELLKLILKLASEGKLNQIIDNL